MHKKRLTKKRELKIPDREEGFIRMILEILSDEMLRCLLLIVIGALNGGIVSNKTSPIKIIYRNDTKTDTPQT